MTRSIRLLATFAFGIGLSVNFSFLILINCSRAGSKKPDVFLHIKKWIYSNVLSSKPTVDKNFFF